MAKGFRQLERIVRGFSNHRRIQMLEVLTATPEIDLMQLARACGINFRNASEHSARLVRAGLVLKRSKGRQVLHAVSPRGMDVLSFLRNIEENNFHLSIPGSMRLGARTRVAIAAQKDGTPAPHPPLCR